MTNCQNSKSRRSKINKFVPLEIYSYDFVVYLDMSNFIQSLIKL